MAPASTFAELVAGHLSARRSVLLLTVVRSSDPVHYPTGAKVVCPEGCEPVIFGLDTVRARDLLAHASAAGGDSSPGVLPIRLEQQQVLLSIYRERLTPPLQCIIAGAGHIGRVLARIGDAMGWAVVVYDDRSDYADADRFGPGTSVICAPFAELAERIRVDEATAIVLVTRGHRYDESCLRALAHTQPLYVGMIGSRRRVTKVMSRLRADGVGEAFLRRVFAPVGLPVDAESPGEIAVAVAAEIVAIRCGRGHWARQVKREYYDL